MGLKRSDNAPSGSGNPAEANPWQSTHHKAMADREKSDFGRYDEKGYWKPEKPLRYGPLLRRPWRPGAVLRWLFGWGGYLWPRHVSYAALVAATWFFLQADLDAVRTLSAGWILAMLGRNLVLLIAVFGFYHVALYVKRVQGTRGKYDPKWQERGKKKFLFRSQVWDNIFWSCVSGVPIWTAYEVFYVWAAARGVMPLVSWTSNPVWFVAWLLIIPLWRETHFYFVHRLLHWKPLLRAVHSNHHKNPNPGPWSGMSMHPVEHLAYFSCLLIHAVVPSHPIHVFYDAQLTALTPAQGHSGFHGPLFKGRWPVGDYFHYLHHRYVSCNFGGGTIPWDRWLGRFYDGEGPYRTKES